ncbi:TetR/AcrR family transcriptional regulator [Streptomyces sp. NPDC002159]
MTISRPRTLRADAQRNYDALVAAGHEVFVSHGVDAPFDEVAKRAGVGRATLYRNFPTREHLFVVLLGDQLDLLREEAEGALAAGASAVALASWLRLYYQTGRRYRGMSAHLATGADRGAHGHADTASPLALACAPMRAAFAALLAAAQQEGTVRDDVAPEEVLALISGLPSLSATESGSPYLDVVLDGLRA